MPVSLSVLSGLMMARCAIELLGRKRQLDVYLASPVDGGVALLYVRDSREFCHCPAKL